MRLKWEPNNVEDKPAVATIRRGAVVGHVAGTLAPMFPMLLKRSCNKELVQTTRKKMNEPMRVWAMALKHPASIVSVV